MTKHAVLTLLIGAAIGCTKNISSNGEGDTAGSVACEGRSNGVTTTVIDSTDEEAWVYMDFEGCALVSIDSPESNTGWDLGLMRFNPKLNGGVSGAGGMEVAIVDGVPFDSISAAPLDGYITDSADDDDDGIPEYAMEGWYDYDMEAHTLAPFDFVYVLKTVEGGHIKLQFESYYDDAGTAGIIQFSWAFIDPPGSDSEDNDGGDDDGASDDSGDADAGGDPSPDDDVDCASGDALANTSNDGDAFLTVIDSASTAQWTCFSFTDSSQVATGWDVAWKNWDTTTSAHASGAIVSDQDFDAIETVPDADWSTGDTDVMDDWFNYDSSTHHVTPKDQVYLIQDADGLYWKLVVTTYYEGGDVDGVLHRPTFRWAALSGTK